MASTIITSVVTGGTNSHATTSAEVNAPATDFIHAGVGGPITLNSGSGGTGSFCVNARATPAMSVDVKAGTAWITATPTNQTSQKLRPYMSADYSSYTINANSSGSTKYDWIYLSVDATKANTPASDASDVTSLYTSRSSSNTADNGTPPTYGILLAVVTVANGASSITNSNISDKRTTATFRSSPATSGVNSIDISTAATGGTPALTAQGSDANIGMNLVGKGTSFVNVNGAPFAYGALVFNSATIAITTGTETLVTWDSEDFDANGFHSTGSNTSRLTVPTGGGGVYLMIASVSWASSSAGNRMIRFKLNGSVVSNYGGSNIIGSSISGLAEQSASSYIKLSAGDYVELNVFQTSGGSLSLAAGARFGLFRVG